MRKRASKWLKYSYMIKSKKVAPHVPETRIMTNASLRQLLRKYRRVIVKPVLGSRGRGVMMVTKRQGRQYLLHTESRKRVIQSKVRLLKILRSKMRGRPHVVQRRINLATVNRHPFDIRVVVQRRTPDTPWTVTGMVAKVAGKGYIVTNIARSKGKVMQVKDAIRNSSLQGRSPLLLTSRLKQVALLSAERLARLYRRHLIFGFDMGLDQAGHVWVIEANLKPLLSHFMKLRDRTMYRRILSYKKDVRPRKKAKPRIMKAARLGMKTEPEQKKAEQKTGTIGLKKAVGKKNPIRKMPDYP